MDILNFIASESDRLNFYYLFFLCAFIIDSYQNQRLQQYKKLIVGIIVFLVVSTAITRDFLSDIAFATSTTSAVFILLICYLYLIPRRGITPTNYEAIEIAKLAKDETRKEAILKSSKQSALPLFFIIVVIPIFLITLISLLKT